jgi:hypothetical protein
MTPTDPLLAQRRVRRRLVSIEAAAIAGVVCALGWALSLRGLLRSPGLDATDTEIVEYYGDPSNARSALIWVQVLVVGTIAFLWFVGVIRGRLGDREPRLFGTVFFGSAVLLAALLFVAAALLTAPSVLVEVGDREPDPGAASMSRAAAAVVLSVFTPRVATLVVFSTASLGRATGALPRWLVWVSYTFGLFTLVDVSISTPGLYIVPAWIALVSVVLLIRRPPRGFDLDPTGDTGRHDDGDLRP